MKILTVVGTRPEIIRLSRIIPKLDKLCNHILVHTGQNYDKNLNDIFFEELRLRKPDYYIGAIGSFGKQISTIIEKIEEILNKEKPDKVLILGDTNSGLASYVAERIGIPTYHMEAGNRCGDKKVPEEINRKIIDHISSYNFPYTPNSRRNLYKEGINTQHVMVSGNPIYEVIKYYENNINNSKILDTLNLQPKDYFLSTFHRAESVDIPERLHQLIIGLEAVAIHYGKSVICSVHPRTRSKLKDYIKPKELVFLKPMGFFDFIKLEKNAKAILSDSGTVCEEACILKVPHIIIRDNTERPETVKVGASIVSGVNGENILNCTKTMLLFPTNWDMPEGYLDINVSEKIIKHLMEKI